MNYELAKELKDTGFDQTGTICSNELECTICDTCSCECDSWSKHESAYVLYPRLPELIEACGDDFEKIERMTIGGVNKWYVEGGNDDSDIETSGSTPEEAVARLWLALNK